MSVCNVNEHGRKEYRGADVKPDGFTYQEQRQRKQRTNSWPDRLIYTTRP